MVAMTRLGRGGTWLDEERSSRLRKGGGQVAWLREMLAAAKVEVWPGVMERRSLALSRSLLAVSETRSGAPPHTSHPDVDSSTTT